MQVGTKTNAWRSNGQFKSISRLARRSDRLFAGVGGDQLFDAFECPIGVDEFARRESGSAAGLARPSSVKRRLALSHGDLKRPAALVEHDVDHLFHTRCLSENAIFKAHQVYAGSVKTSTVSMQTNGPPVEICESKSAAASATHINQPAAAKTQHPPDTPATRVPLRRRLAGSFRCLDSRRCAG